MTKIKVLIALGLLLFVLSACDTSNNTCPNGTPFMWVEGIHCIGGQEFTTPPVP